MVLRVRVAPWVGLGAATGVREALCQLDLERSSTRCSRWREPQRAAEQLGGAIEREPFARAARGLFGALGGFLDPTRRLQVADQHLRVANRLLRRFERDRRRTDGGDELALPCRTRTELAHARIVEAEGAQEARLALDAHLAEARLLDGLQVLGALARRPSRRLAEKPPPRMTDEALRPELVRLRTQGGSPYVIHAFDQAIARLDA